MSEPLRITEIRTDLFGGLRDTRLEIGGDPFVVVMGRNETGKSSLTTLLSWLLVGPYGSATDAQRFGDAGDRIGGTLHATLGDDPVTSEGSFTVLDRGAPRVIVLAMALRGTSFDASAWRETVLRGIDSEVLKSIYVMAGADLHEGQAVRKGIAALAVSGMSGAGGALQAVNRLEEDARKAIDAGGKAQSFKTISKGTRKLTREINDLSADISDYSSKKGEIDTLQTDQRVVEASLAELRTELRVIDTVIELQPDLEEIRNATDGLNDLPEVPDPWMAVVAPEVGFESLLEELVEAEDDLSECCSAFVDACDDLGLTPAEGEAVQVSNVDIEVAARLGGECGRKEDQLSDAVEREQAIGKEVALAKAELTRTLNAGDDLTPDSIRSIRLDGDDGDLSEAIGRMVDAEEAVGKAKQEFDTAEGQYELAVSDRERQLARWHTFHPGIPPEQWLANPTGPVEAVQTAGTGVRVVAGLFALAALIVVGAVLVTPPAVAAAITAVTFAAAYFVVRMVKPAVPPASFTGDPAIREAANDAFLAADRVRDAERAVDEARREAGRRASTLEDRTSDVDALTSTAGFTTSGDAAVRRAQVRAIKDALEALHEYDDAERELKEAIGLREQAEVDLSDADGALLKKLSEWEVPNRLDARAAATSIAGFQNLTRCSLDVARAQSACDAAAGKFGICAKPVAEEIADLDHARIRQVFDDHRNVAKERSRLHAAIALASKTVDRRFTNGARARDLAGEGLDAVELGRRRQEVEDECERLEGERNGIVQQIADIRADVKAAEEKDSLADLQLELGGLVDLADQCVLDGAVASLAASVLREVAEEQRQQNQPALIIRATELLKGVVPGWEQLRVDPGSGDDLDITIRRTDGTMIAVSKLSTGSQALLYLALRIAAAEQDAESRRSGLRFPILCDDPLVHFDDERARTAAQMLASAASRGHQVVLFTCHGRTEQAAHAAGAAIRRLD
jgi:uncharacterized protein YhaN